VTRRLDFQRVALWLGGGALLLLLLGLLGIQLQAARLERAVLADLAALPVLPTTRPSHVDPPLPGSVSELLLQRAAAAHPPLPWEREPFTCDDARWLPADQLPQDCASTVTAFADWSRALLEASRAADARLPDGLERARLDIKGPSISREVPFAMAIVSHEVRRAVGRGQADQALSWCADALGMGRDYVLRLGPSGVWFASYWAVLFTTPCGEALDAAAPQAKRTFATAVDRIAAALPPDGQLLRQLVAERVLDLYGADFSDATLDSLPREVSQRVRDRNPAAPRFLSPLWRRLRVREAMALRSTLEAIDQPPAARDAIFLRARERLASLGERELKVDEFFDRVDRLRVLLALLSNAARLDAGDVRSAAAGLSLVKESGDRVLIPTTARLARHAVRLHADAQ
jgi:hypothetical protein